MKSILSVLLISISFNAMAESSLEVTADDDSVVKVSWLGTEVDESEVELLWDHGSLTALFHGYMCFNGEASEVIEILEYLDSEDMVGDEYSIREIYSNGPGKITYEVYDGPNETVASEVTIETCTETFTQKIRCGDDTSGFDIDLVVQGENIILNESTVALNGDLSPDWYPISGQVEEVDENDDILTLAIGSWSAAADDPYNFEVEMSKDLLSRPFRRAQGKKITADGTEEVCYSYIEK